MPFYRFSFFKPLSDTYLLWLPSRLVDHFISYAYGAEPCWTHIELLLLYFLCGALAKAPLVLFQILGSILSNRAETSYLILRKTPENPIFRKLKKNLMTLYCNLLVAAQFLLIIYFIGRYRIFDGYYRFSFNVAG